MVTSRLLFLLDTVHQDDLGLRRAHGFRRGVACGDRARRGVSLQRFFGLAHVSAALPR